MFIDWESVANALKLFGQEGPFDHCVIDNFFLPKVADQLIAEFPPFDADVWHKYENPIEIKKVCNNWNVFPQTTYQVFRFLNSPEFIQFLSEHALKGKKLYPDIGLNGAGWHTHRRGGKLNTHLDYSIHPKLGLQRKLNIIIYLTPHWKPEWGGQLGFWGNEKEEAPGKLIKSVMPLFNRAVVFDTTQNSWHGLPEPINCPEDICRQSLAIYYLAEPAPHANQRGKALFAPMESQKEDQAILDLIQKRADVKHSHEVYVEESIAEVDY